MRAGEGGDGAGGVTGRMIGVETRGGGSGSGVRSRRRVTTVSETCRLALRTPRGRGANVTSSSHRGLAIALFSWAHGKVH
jgi:hypothetical protein